MVIQVGGSISFAPETDGAAAKWLSDDTRHMLAELDPKPDQVTVTVNTTQMNVVEQMEIADLAGTSLAEPANYQAYREMTVPSGPGWVEEHVRRLSAAGIQSAFQFYNINSYETVERLIRRGVYKGPLVMNWVAIGGGMDAPNIYNLANFLRAIPDGSMLTVESSMRNVLPINMMGIAMGLHVRCGIEDNLWNQSRTEKMSDGEADRAAGAHLARVRPRGRHRQGSARDLQDRRLLRHRRGDAGGQRLRAQRQGPPAGLPAQGRLRSERHRREPTVLIVPGLRDHVAQHWQTLLAARLQAARRPVRSVPPMGRDDLTARRASRRSSARRRPIDGPIVIVAHSGGCVMVAHWARQTRRAVRGALLATPPDFERRCPRAIRRSTSCAPAAGCRCRASGCRFRSIVAASRNDPLAALRARRRHWPRDWGSRLVDLGEVGHLNPASGFGDWPRADASLRSPSSCAAR